jgi:hypothetical protein
LSSWRLTTSGSVLANQERRLSSRLLMLLMLNVATLTRALAAAALPAAYQKDHLRSLVSAGIIPTVETNTNPEPTYTSARNLVQTGCFFGTASL